MADALSTTKSAIQALQNPAQTKAANDWLVTFERTQEAWQIADALLREPEAFRFFGSITLYNKCQRDIDQMDRTVVPGLMQTVVQHIIRISTEIPFDSKCCRYLCLSLASLAVQVNQDGVVKQILVWLNPIMASSPEILLDLLTVLPEECDNFKLDVTSDTREAFFQQLSQTAEEVFGFLLYLRSQAGSSVVRNKILQCLQQWIKYTYIPGSILSGHEVFRFALECLAVEDLFENSIGVVITTWEKFGSDDISIIEKLYPAILSLKSLWDHRLSALRLDSEDDDSADICRAISQAVAATAEACLPVIVGEQGESLSDLLQFAVEVSSLQGHANISRHPTKFFYDLSLLMKKARGALRTEALEPYLDSMEISTGAPQRIIPRFGQYLEAVVARMEIREAIVIGGEPMTDPEFEIRKDLYDCVVDSADAMGAPLCVRHLCGLLQKAVEAPPISYVRVEAILRAISLTAVDLTPAEDDLLGQLMAFVSNLPAEIQGLQLTSVHLIGKCCRWFSNNPASIPGILTRLFTALTQETTQAAAAGSIRNLLKTCAGKTELPLQQLLEAASSLRASGSITKDTDEELLEGFCVAITHLPEGQKDAALTGLVDPLVQRLTAILELPGSPDARQLGQEIDRMTVVLRHLRVESTQLLAIFSRVYPLLHTALDKNPSESICERVCRCFKYTMRNCDARVFLPVLPHIIANVTTNFQKIPVAAFLYAGAICMQEFSRVDGGSQQGILYAMLWNLSETFFTHMGSLENFQQKPDLVEEYFYLIARALQYCPGPMLSAEGFGRIVQAGLTGLQLEHKDAQKGILTFFERLVELPKSPEHAATTAPLVTQVAPHVVQLLLLCLSGQMPLSAISGNNGSVSDVLWNLREFSPPGLEAWISQVLGALSANAQTVAGKMNFAAALAGATRRREFNKILEDFERRCTAR